MKQVHSGTRYFTPRFVKMVVGDKITWYNANDESHSLIFDKESFSRTFDVYVPRIGYSCATHPEEKGTIVIYPKEEVEMTNTET